MEWKLWSAKWKYARILPPLKWSLKHEGKIKTILKCVKNKIDTIDYYQVTLTKGTYAAI